MRKQERTVVFVTNYTCIVVYFNVYKLATTRVKSATLNPSTRCGPIAIAQLVALSLTNGSGLFLYSSNNAMVFILKVRKLHEMGKSQP